MSPYRPRHQRRMFIPSRPLIAFLLIASFGILFAGCGSAEPEETVEEFSFTEQDIARFRELVDEAATQTGTGAVPELAVGETGSGGGMPVLDLSKVQTYNALRSGVAASGENVFKVTNTFLNVRTAPSVTAASNVRLDLGDVVTLIEFVDAAWAKVKLPDGSEGFVSTRYIAKMVPEEKLAEERKKYEGTYFVDFGFLNVRATADTEGTKLGELPGQALVKPLTVGDAWARILFEGKEGYAAMDYLEPFVPNFIVRQEKYVLPVLQYQANQPGSLTSMTTHIVRLKNEGYKLMTLADFYNFLQEQEEQDVRLDPRSVVLTVSGITPENIDEASNALVTANANATLFITTKGIGIDGITEKKILTLIANGYDIQSAGHTGDDLRSLTNAQVELELAQSRKIIEDVTRKEVFAIGFPVGGVNDRVMELAAKAGYLFGVTTAPERSFDRTQFLRMPSFLVTANETAENVLNLVKGSN